METPIFRIIVGDKYFAGEISVDVKPIQRPAEPLLEEDEFDSMPIEKINQYLREHGYDQPTRQAFIEYQCLKCGRRMNEL